MKSAGRRAVNKELQARFVWIKKVPASTRSQRKQLEKLARLNGTVLPGMSDHKEVIAAMKSMKVIDE